MKKLKKPVSNTKTKLHVRNKHNSRYDFKSLIEVNPNLKSFVKVNEYGDETISFFDDQAVLELNKSLLFSSYNLTFWDIPKGYLCPPIPGRADYIHNVADLLYGDKLLPFRKGEKITCLDIGVGANCIYPVIGVNEYNWNFIGTDTNDISIESANEIVSRNTNLENKVELRKQEDLSNIFKGIVHGGEIIDVVICNPPFHKSKREAAEGSRRKNKNLTKGKKKDSTLNFGGKFNELWCEGGELGFIFKMIQESKSIERQCLWFTSLVSKQDNVDSITKKLKSYNVKDFKVINMGQGNKVSRMIAWTFLPPLQHAKWKQFRWKKDN